MQRKFSFLSKGNSKMSMVVVFAIILFSSLFAASYGTVDRDMIPSYDQHLTPITLTPEPGKSTLQLQTLSFITTTPTPVPPSQPPHIAQGPHCQQDDFNDEPKILVGFDPGPGKTVGAGGKIRVWITDENPPFISTGEVIDANTGAITKPGNRDELDGRGSNYYRVEPALYIAPNLAENGGTPYYPTAIKGQYSTYDGVEGKGPPIDSDWTSFANGPDYLVNYGAGQLDDYTDEYVWDVSSLGLSKGTYSAEFVIHDGDIDLGVGCTTIIIS